MEEDKSLLSNSENEEIKNLIYTVRGKQVMLDSDVAMLYHYDTKRINETVRRNKERFPENFCFQLTSGETKILRSQIATASESDKYRNNRYLPFAFTEQGVAMLSGLLKNKIAIQVSINIMNAFVEMRNFLLSYGHIFNRLTSVEYKLLEHDENFEKVFNELQKNENQELKQNIFFQGQIYDAYSLIIEIIKKAKRKILTIDNYIGHSILEMLTKKNRKESL